jgi:hypothetical protein
MGTAVGLWRAHRAGADLPLLMDAAAPALLVAQAIGRVGNYFNQELFGRPTSLPWGLEIDPEHRPDRYAADPTFHPTFLYEIVWNLALAGFLVWLGRTGRVRSPGLFALYVAGYSAFRILRGAVARRSRPPHPRAAAELLHRGAALRGGPCVVRVHPARRAASATIGRARWPGGARPGVADLRARRVRRRPRRGRDREGPAATERVGLGHVPQRRDGRQPPAARGHCCAVGAGPPARQSRQMALKCTLRSAPGGASMDSVNVLFGDLARAQGRDREAPAAGLCAVEAHLEAMGDQGQYLGADVRQRLMMGRMLAKA